MAKKNQLNVSIGVDTKGYAKSWDDVVKITQESGSDVEKEAAKMALAVAKKIENMTPKQQARQLENLTVKMVNMGLDGTKAFGMVASSAGKLKAEIDDAKGAINAMRPDAPFNALNTTLGASAQAFAGVQGAMALFGSESEDLQKTLVKVQGAMALAEGFKAIDGLTDGFKQLNLVIKQNPLIAGAAIFAAATAAIVALTNATSALELKQNALKEISDKAFESTIQEKTGLQQLLKVYNDKNTSDEERLAIQRQIVKDYPEYLGQISTENVEQQKTNTAIEGYISLLDIKAKAQAAQELYVEALKEERKLASEYAKDQMQLAGMGANPAARYILEGLGLATGNQRLQEATDKVKAYGKEYDILFQKAQAAEKAQVTDFGVPDAPKPKPTPKAEPTKLPLPTGGRALPKTSEIPATDEYNNPIPPVPEETIESHSELGTVMDILIIRNKGLRDTLLQTERQMQSMAQLAESISSSIKTLAVDSISSFAMALGETIGGSEDAMQSFGKKLLGAIVSFMETVSKAMIAAAIASEVFQKLLFTNPIAALGAGVALGIAAGIVKSQMTKGVQGEGFAKGGLIGGNSFSGDKLFAPVNSGEVILNTGQQNALLRLANGGGGGYMAETRISGRDLAIVLKKYQIDNARG